MKNLRKTHRKELANTLAIAQENNPIFWISNILIIRLVNAAIILE
jgi:hypothetical protein